MIKSLYTFFRILLVALIFAFFFFSADKINYPFFITVLAFTVSIPAKRLLREDARTYFETKLNYFLDEFFVYGAVILLSTHGFAPLFVVIIYFYKDATIGAIRNFAIKKGEHLSEKIGYKIDKVVQYTVIIAASLSFMCNPADLFPKGRGCGNVWLHGYMLHALFYASAIISAITLISFYIANRKFVKTLHNS